MTSTTGDGIDWTAVGAWMDSVGLPAGTVEDPRRLTGGTQNILMSFTRGPVAYVLRRGPEHLRPTSNDAMRREMRVLEALAGTGVPHPRLIAGCPDEDVLGGAAFYLMEPVEGFNPTVELPPAYANPAVRRAAGFAVVDALATLGAVDHEKVGLGDVGRPDGFLQRQVPRWLAELEGYARHEGYPGPDIPGLDEVAAWLEAHRPRTFTPGVSHGDFHLANLLLRRDRPQVAAIVDWEMCTVGDPLLDLGWLLATWPAVRVGPADENLANAGGLPTRDELIERYAERSDRDLTAIDWYRVLAAFKLGIVLEGTHARACAGRAPVAVGDALHEATLALFRGALEIVR